VIYLAAHRVRDRNGEVGINSFRYRTKPDITHLWESIDRNAGTLVSSSIAVKPGNNAVLSYLDVVLPDEWHGSIPELLEPLGGAIAMATRPLTRSLEDAHVRFGAVIGLSGELARREFHSLARALVTLAASSTSASTSVSRIRLVRRSQGDRDIYQLGSGSTSSVTVAKDVTSDLQLSDGGGLLPFVAGALTGMSIHELAQAGGVDVYDGDGNFVLRWPASTD
jgi:hypothetical protein